MSYKEQGASVAEQEATREVEVMYIGRLGDLDLGNPDGIPSELADSSEEEVAAYGEKLKDALDYITDFTHLSCIDGRCVVCNADGSSPEIRPRQVGATGKRVEVAILADAPVMDTVPEEAELDETTEILDEHCERINGIKPSAHEGGCGSLNGAVEDGDAITEIPAIMKATETFLSLPVVSDFTGVAFNAVAGEKVVANGSKMSGYLRSKNWVGQNYVDKVKSHEPVGVETLVVNTDRHKGHKENAVVFVLSKDRSISEKKLAELNLGDVFVINVDQSVVEATALAGDRGMEGVQQALIADTAKHMAVANRLPSTKTPIFVIKDY